MSEIDPGDGFRLIDKEKDTPKLGDQFHNGKAWFDRPSPFTPFTSIDTYRRRIPAKPENFMGQNIWTWREGNRWFWETLPGRRVSDSAEARQFAAWLQHYSDWLEEQ
jgi:hypothetical protein